MNATLSVRSPTAAIWATRVVFAGNGGLFATWASRIPAVRDRLDADARGLGFALLFTAVGSLIAMPLSSRFIAWIGERRVIAVCVTACVLAYPALGLAPNLVVLGAILLVVGAGTGVWDVAMNVAANAVEEQAGRTLMPGFHAWWSLGTVAGAGFGALAAHADLSPFATFGSASLVVAVAAALAVPHLPNAHESTDDHDGRGRAPRARPGPDARSSGTYA